MDLEPFIDKSPSLSEDNLIVDIQKRLPNLPIVYWNKNKNTPMGFNNTCARFVLIPKNCNRTIIIKISL